MGVSPDVYRNGIGVEAVELAVEVEPDVDGLKGKNTVPAIEEDIDEFTRIEVGYSVFSWGNSRMLW